MYREVFFKTAKALIKRRNVELFKLIEMKNHFGFSGEGAQALSGQPPLGEDQAPARHANTLYTLTRITVRARREGQGGTALSVC